MTGICGKSYQHDLETSFNKALYLEKLGMGDCEMFAIDTSQTCLEINKDR